PVRKRLDALLDHACEEITVLSVKRKDALYVAVKGAAHEPGLFEKSTLLCLHHLLDFVSRDVFVARKDNFVHFVALARSDCCCNHDFVWCNVSRPFESGSGITIFLQILKEVSLPLGECVVAITVLEPNGDIVSNDAI